MVRSPEISDRLGVKVTSVSDSGDTQPTVEFSLSGILKTIYEGYDFAIANAIESVALAYRTVDEKELSIHRAIEDDAVPLDQDIMSLITKEELLSDSKRFLSEMALVYLITLQEGFIKDYLFAILIHRRELLRTQETITYEDLASFESLDSMIAFIAQRKIDELTGIDEVAKFFEKRLGLSLKNDFSSWTQLVEANYRRNVIVHNQGNTNEIYCQRTGHKGLGEHLDTDVEYVQKISSVIQEFIEFIHSKLSSKFAAREGVN